MKATSKIEWFDPKDLPLDGVQVLVYTGDPGIPLATFDRHVGQYRRPDGGLCRPILWTYIPVPLIPTKRGRK